MFESGSADKTTYHILRPKNVKHRYVPTSPDGPKHFSANGKKPLQKSRWKHTKHECRFSFFLYNTPAPTVANGIRFYPNAQQGFPFHSGGWELRVCSLDAAQPFATLRNRSQPFATVRMRALWPCLWGLLQKNAYTFRGFKRRVTSLRVAGVVVRVESSGGRMQIPWQGWYFMRCVEN